MTSTIYSVSCIHNYKRLVLNVFCLSLWALLLEVSSKDSGSSEESGSPWLWPGAVPLVSPCAPCFKAFRFPSHSSRGVMSWKFAYFAWFGDSVFCWNLRSSSLLPLSLALLAPRNQCPLKAPGEAKAPGCPSWQIFLSFNVSVHFVNWMLSCASYSLVSIILLLPLSVFFLLAWFFFFIFQQHVIGMAHTQQTQLQTASCRQEQRIHQSGNKVGEKWRTILEKNPLGSCTKNVILKSIPGLDLLWYCIF